MNYNDQAAGWQAGGITQAPWRLATVRGEPYAVAGYKLTPVARVLSYAIGQGTLRARSISGWGGGMVFVRPVAIEVERDGRTRRIKLARSTRASFAAMVAAGATITILLWWVRLLARRGRRLSRDG